MATKENQLPLYRIMSLDGSVLYKNIGFTASKSGKANPEAFRGTMDESLDTMMMSGLYNRYKKQIGYPFTEGDKRYCRALVNISFERAVKVYESYGNRYVLNGHSVTDEDMSDHVCIRNVDGIQVLIAVEVSYSDKNDYAPVEHPLSAEMLGKYFIYDEKARAYKRSSRTIPSDVTCNEIREYLYAHGFDIDGVHYVRYKRSAGASRDGRCLFIAEPHSYHRPPPVRA